MVDTTDTDKPTYVRLLIPGPMGPPGDAVSNRTIVRPSSLDTDHSNEVQDVIDFYADKFTTTGRTGTVQLDQGDFLLGSSLKWKSGVEIYGVGNATRLMSSAANGAIEIPPAGFVTSGKLGNFKIVNNRLAGSRTKRDCAMYLRAHNYCTIGDIEFEGYTDQILIMRKSDYRGPGVQNTVFNHYGRFIARDIARIFCWSEGLADHHTEILADGVQTNFVTTWNPENARALVAVIWSQADGELHVKKLHTDYTFSGGGASPATVHFLTPPAAGDYVKLWPSVPGRPLSPISNNFWMPMIVKTITKALHYIVYFCDTERFLAPYGQINADNAHHFDINPLSGYGAQTDFYTIWSPALPYKSISSGGGVTDPSTISAIRMGPGGRRVEFQHLIVDHAWDADGAGPIVTDEIALISTADERFTDLTGTITLTAGSDIGVGTGTLFTEQLQALSSPKDSIFIPSTGEGYAVIAVTDNTHIQFSKVVVTATAGAVAFQRDNYSSEVSYRGTLAGFGGSARFTAGHTGHNQATRAGGQVVIKAGQTQSPPIKHRCWREPLPEEISITPLTMGTPVTPSTKMLWRLGNIGLQSFFIDLATAMTTDVTFVWRTDLIEFLPPGAPPIDSVPPDTLPP